MTESFTEKRYFLTHLSLEEFVKSLPDKPKNKKLKKVAKHISAIFRYKWEEEKARNSLEYWHKAIRETTLELRDKILKQRKFKK